VNIFIYLLQHKTKS